MPINTDLLIAAPMLQDSFVDKNGEPMSGGVITCFQDNSRTTLKNWYYQSGTPGNYTYIRLPNPLTLSAAGTICDINGVDTIPFFYPYSELDQTVRQPYYITIVNHAQTNQITRANFPFLPSGGSTPGEGSDNNYIINNGFWRNIGSMNLLNVLDTVVAPSQHDGFVYPDVHFIKNVTGGQDTVTFVKFPLTIEPILTDDITPEFYINHQCANSNTGELQKCYQFPISLHVNTLASVPYTVTIQAQNAGGIASGSNTITLFIFQDTGTGTTPPAPFRIGEITLNSGWQKYEFSAVFPSTSELTLGKGGDDALYLQVQMPLDINCNINFTRPSIFLSNTVPTNSFLTYDQVNSVINTPRTGDVRTSINEFYPYGWVAMNDGVIGLDAMNVSGTNNIPGYSRGNSDTWRLFNLIWSIGKQYDTGANFNPVCQMYTNTGSALVATNYDANAYVDFAANNAITLTRMFGRVILGNVPSSAEFEFYAPQSQGVTASSSSGLLITPTTIGPFWQGAPVTFEFAGGGSLPGNITANTVYYVTNLTGSNFRLATTYANAIAGTPVVAFSSAGSNVFVNFYRTGVAIGENSHTQLVTELAAHHHSVGTATSGSIVGSGAPYLSTNPGAFMTGDTGSSTPFNIMQPGVFYNIFMKL